MSRVKSCRFCLHPHTVCGCSQVASWSHTSTRQTLAMATTTHFHDTTSMSTSIACPPPGLPPQEAAAPTSTYSKALAFGQAPETHMRGVSQPPLPGAGYPSVDPCQTAPTPRMEAPIREEHPVSTQEEPITPYQQQIQAPILSTHSTEVRRGAILEMMRKKSQELECQAASVGRRRRLSTKCQGAIPKQTGETPGQDPQGLVCGRSWSCLQKGFDKDNGANQLHAQEVEHLPPLVEPPLLPQSSWVAFTPGTLQTLGERGGKRMLIRHTCSTSLSPSMSPLKKLRPSPLQYLGTWSKADAGGIL